MATRMPACAVILRRPLKPMHRWPEGIYASAGAYDTVMNRIYNIGLRKSKSYNYSCLNFALLSDIQQRLTGVDFDQWVDTEIFGPREQTSPATDLPVVPGRSDSSD